MHLLVTLCQNFEVLAWAQGRLQNQFLGVLFGQLRLFLNLPMRSEFMRLASMINGPVALA